jgi:cytochrome c
VRPSSSLFTTVLLAGAVVCAPARAADAERGKELYESRCIGCHSIDANRVGPAHQGVYGRKAGAVPDYDYSPALKRSKIVWNAKTLDRWLANPSALVPGTKMGFSVADRKDRADLVEYLKSQSPK